MNQVAVRHPDRTQVIVEPLASVRNCRICGYASRAIANGTVTNGFPLFSCGHCQTVLIENIPRPAALDLAYDHLFERGAYDAHREEFHQLKSGKTPRNVYRKHFLKRLEQMTPGRRLIEIGGGTGSFGVLAQNRGWKYTDYDISAVAIDFAARLSLDARVFRLGGPPPIAVRSADAIVMWEVIEHVWDVHEYLATIFNALKGGGVFLLSTPNYLRPTYRQAVANGRPVGSVPPVHVNFFTPLALKRSLEAAGFDSVTVKKRRLYRPSLREPLSSLMLALGLLESTTLIGIARKI